MSTFATLKGQIVSKLESITDLDQTDQVFNYEPKVDEVATDPFAVVVATDNESDYETTKENLREYGFLIRVYVERKNRGESDAESVMTTLIDLIIDAFDQDITLGGNALMTLATPSAWIYSLGAKEYRVGEIRIRARVSFDTST